VRRSEYEQLPRSLDSLKSIKAVIQFEIGSRSVWRGDPVWYATEKPLENAPRTDQGWIESNCRYGAWYLSCGLLSEHMHPLPRPGVLRCILY
jgi:hypothetical protein